MRSSEIIVVALCGKMSLYALSIKLFCENFKTWDVPDSFPSIYGRSIPWECLGLNRASSPDSRSSRGLRNRPKLVQFRWFLE
jgi:hypothetical protein